MPDQRTRCLFCFAESDAFPKLTREHVVSRPVARAFGIDRTSPFLRTNAEQSVTRWGVVCGQSRKIVCAPCNNGWMNALEERMAALADWMHSGGEALGGPRSLTLRSWALKTHMLLCVIEGKADRLGEDGVEDAVIAPWTLARQLYEKNVEAIGGIPLGLARSPGPGDFVYAFGTPTMARTGPREFSNRTAPASIITVGSLQLWIVTPMFDAVVRVPDNVQPCTSDLTPSHLRPRSALGDLEAIVVDYGASAGESG